MTEITDEKDVLEDLFVDRSAVLDQGILKEILIDNVQLTKEGGVIPIAAFHNLRADKKVLLILLAKKVLRIKLGSEEKLTPKEIIEITGLPKGTVAPAVRTLEEGGYVRSDKGAYWIPDSLIYKIKQLIDANNK